MKVELDPKAAKYLNRLNNPDKGRIIKALDKVTEEPPKGDIKSLTEKTVTGCAWDRSRFYLT